MAVRINKQDVESLAQTHRAASRVAANIEASAVAVSSWSRLLPDLLQLSVVDPQTSLAIFTATDRLLKSMSAGPATIELDDDDADGYGPEIDASDRARIASAAEAISRGDVPTVPFEVVKRISDGTHRIRAWREHRGMTQSELAARAKLTQGAIADIERGRRRPGTDALRGIASALGVHPSLLMD